MQNTIPFPDKLEYWEVDEVAECIEGINESTYVELWKMLEQAANNGTAKPLGGDGSDGTTEEPIVSNYYGSSLKTVWGKLSKEARENISEAVVIHFKGVEA